MNEKQQLVTRRHFDFLFYFLLYFLIYFDFFLCKLREHEAADSNATAPLILFFAFFSPQVPYNCVYRRQQIVTRWHFDFHVTVHSWVPGDAYAVKESGS